MQAKLLMLLTELIEPQPQYILKHCGNESDGGKIKVFCVPLPQGQDAEAVRVQRLIMGDWPTPEIISDPNSHENAYWDQTATLEEEEVLATWLSEGDEEAEPEESEAVRTAVCAMNVQAVAAFMFATPRPDPRVREWPEWAPKDDRWPETTFGTEGDGHCSRCDYIAGVGVLTADGLAVGWAEERVVFT